MGRHGKPRCDRELRRQNLGGRFGPGSQETSGSRIGYGHVQSRWPLATGASQITGASADGDILIGGTTSYDSNTTAHVTALEAILTEWQSTDSYSTRFTDINTGTIPGGYSLNYGTAVLDNGYSDVLIGAGSALALDWFFAGNHDQMVNFVAGEHVNNN